MCEVKVENRTRVEEHGRTVLYEKIYRGVPTQGGGLRLLAYYYENTVFEVVSLELKSQTENEISFSVCVSKGGIVQEPDRTIFLEFVNGHWEVVNEGY